MHNESIPYGMLNRYGRRSLVAMQRKQPHHDAMFEFHRERRLVAESRARGLAIRIERIKKRKEARIKMETIGKSGLL